MSQYEARISKNADGEFYALIVRIDRDGQASVIHGYKGRHFATMKAAKKSTDAYISKMYATNPARRIGTAHPKRKSEATKKTPTKRLVARRKRNTKAGYYPNPLESQVHRTRTKKNVDHPINFPYAVQYKNTGTGEWHSLSAFKELEKAKEYAAAYANAHPYMYVRVEHATEI